MRALKWGAFVCATLIAVAAHAGPEVGDYSGLPKDLAAAAVDYDLAQFRSNRAELDRLLADDYVLFGTGGRTLTKADALADAAAPAGANKSVMISQQVKRAWPNGAVLAGVVDASEVRDGKRTAIKARFTDVWAKRQGRWRVIFTQIDRIP
ncbi:MAG: nuclear transport factor 2 family protein [Sphingomonas sp.]|nr:nuclear transport factor 2 family protein [Sphingomonas sp.]